MKPDKLVLCGWGPYKGKQEIDFAGLKERGLFLIAGPTGAGKTTIFDAITYALFGNMSGEQREKNSVRSDFAEIETKTYVELTMSHGNRQYIIYRNPEYFRPSKRKTDTKVREKENAILTEEDGTVTEGSSEVTRKIQELLKLDYRQFKQLSMIAQGEFSRMLSAAPGEKTRIFREIFGTDIYEKMAFMLKNKSSGIYKEIMECRHKMDENIDMLVRADLLPEGKEKNTAYFYENIILQLQEKAGEFDEKRTISKKQSEETDAKIQELSAGISETERQKGLCMKLKTEEKRKETFALQADEIHKKEERLQRQERAEKLRPLQAETEFLKEQQKQILDLIEKEQTEIASLEIKNQSEEFLFKQQNAITGAYDLKDKMSSKTQEIQQAGILAEQKDKELCKLQSEYLQAEELEEKDKQKYEHADKAYRHGIAGVLAQLLVEEEPCPVCGAIHHPSPAVLDTEVPTQEQVNQLKDNFEKKQKIRILLHGQTTAALAQKKELTDQLEKLFEEYTRLEDEQKTYTEEITSYVNQNAAEHFRNTITKYEQRLTVIIEKQNNLLNLTEQKTQIAAKMEQAENTFLTALRKASFTDVQDYRNTLTKEGESKILRDEISTYYQDINVNEKLCEHLKEELANYKEIDTDSMQQALEQLKQKKGLLQSEVLLFDNGYQTIERSLTALHDKQLHLNHLMDKYSVLKDLDDTANGNNKKRLVFEQFVLAFYFEEILAAANIRLKIMSGGRYDLRRMEQIQDGRSKDNLEIEVMDYYTGKYRSVKTLSGGESFKASLALALGMSDIVQASNGGIRVEALFIDEGFGSLDSESLEQACLTLQSLVEKDRLIGIISHVPELAEKIGNQIRINKTNAGSTIKVMLN